MFFKKVVMESKPPVTRRARLENNRLLASVLLLKKTIIPALSWLPLIPLPFVIRLVVSGAATKDNVGRFLVGLPHLVAVSGNHKVLVHRHRARNIEAIPHRRWQIQARSVYRDHLG